MALALDLVTDGGGAFGTNTLTFSHTCTGSNLYLIVAITAGGSSVNAVSYGGDAMSLIQGTVGSRRTQLWGLANPKTGSNSVSITMNGSTNIGAVAASYKGASATQPDSVNTQAAASVTFTLSTTVVASNCWLIAWATATGSAPATNNRTDRVKVELGGLDHYYTFSDSNGVVATGSQGATYIVGSSVDAIVMSLAPFVAPTPGVRKIIGVGISR